MKNSLLMTAAATLLMAASLSAHDTWIMVNSPVVRVGDVTHVDLMLGNHGNEHRDFKLASKISPESWTLDVVSPVKTTVDVKARMTDTGYAPKEGYWTTRFVAKESGLHVVAHTLDKLHGTTRAIKSAKSYLLAADSLDQLPENRHDFSKPLGHPLELVPVTDPVRDLCPGRPIEVQLMYSGKPLPKARVSFIPRGQTLAEGFDPKYERTTDADGKASFTPEDGNWILIVVHHAQPEQKGEGYDKTHYTATLTVSVPEVPRTSSAVVRRPAASR